MNPKHPRHAILVRRTAHNSAVGSKPTELRRVLIAALLLALLLALPAPVAAQTSRYLFVSSHINSKVVLYDVTTGALIGDFVTTGLGGLSFPFGLVFGPDGNLYVSSYGNSKVVRYNGTTGAPIDDFVTEGSGGLSGPAGLVFGPDGNLYVMSRANYKVLRYNGTTGAPFPASGKSGADFATAGLGESLDLVFGPDGNLYVSSTADSKVVRFNGTTGDFIDNFIEAGVGGLSNPFTLVFRPDGNLYVVNYGTDKVLRYDGTGAPFPAPGQSGADFATAGLNDPEGLAFGPDGNLYVSSTADSKVVRFNGATGAFMINLDPTGLGGLNLPTFLTFAPLFTLYTTTTITSDNPDPSGVGQAVVVNFSVTSTIGTPTGSVTVSDGVDSCAGTVAAGACAITLTMPGTRTLTATYAGDANFNGSSGATSHQVNKADTTTTITSDNPDPSVVGQAVVVNYTVTSASGTPTGNITVSDGTVNCTGTVAAGACTLKPATAGAKTLTATYAGDANFNGSSGATSHQVNKADTTTTITSDNPDPSAVGQAVVVNFSVTSTIGTPTGSVTVSDGVDSCTGTVESGTCAITLTTLGTRTLTATYAGDANFNGSSDTELHQVNANLFLPLILR